ncbi:MAG: DUF3438 family protein [Methyloprofundus sp.]|nr:DUF3438 family protein [Methyloprofundus sp.]
MSTRLVFVFLFVIFGFIFSGLATAKQERVVFDNQPIAVGLVPGAERVVEFPDVIQVGVPAQVMNLFTGLTFVDNKLFITLKEQIKQPLRLIVRGADGTNYILNIVDTESSPPGRLVVHRSTDSDSVRGQSTRPGAPQHIDSYPFLTRYAMQSLYAPERLIQTNYSLSQLSVNARPMMHFFRCSNQSTACRSLRVTPIAGWQSQRHYITALKIENLSEHAVEVDPRLVRVIRPGVLRTSTSMHGRLLGHQHGDKSQTVMVIIHTVPFEQVIGMY